MNRPPAFRLNLSDPPFGDGSSTGPSILIHAKKYLAWNAGRTLRESGATIQHIRDCLVRGDFAAVKQYPFITGWCVGVPTSTPGARTEEHG